MEESGVKGCLVCGKAIPVNESLAYRGVHEDCYAERFALILPVTPRPFPDHRITSSPLSGLDEKSEVLLGFYLENVGDPFISGGGTPEAARTKSS